MDAMAARAVHASMTRGELPWFGPVARTPGFFRALAETIQELRLNRVDPEALPPAGPSGGDLRSLLASFDQSLREAEAADVASALRIATEAAHRPDFRFAARPLLLLDLFPTSLLEEEFLRALCAAASDVLATAHTRDGASITTLERALTVNAEPLSGPEPARALDRLRTFVFEAAAPAAAMDDSVRFQSATDESRECVEIVRSILDRAAAGAPFDRMAVVLRNPELYQPPLEDALRRAGIPALFTLGSRRPNPAGRALLALLACAAEGLSAARFSEYLSLGQAPRSDAPAPR
jgi:ATP-dependent helicase/DNAse subunit B